MGYFYDVNEQTDMRWRISYAIDGNEIEITGIDSEKLLSFPPQLHNAQKWVDKYLFHWK